MSRPRRKIACYFLTGTGRCGTMLFARLLNLAANTHCNHEHSIHTLYMKEAYFTGNYAMVNQDVERTIIPLVAGLNTQGRSYGESSGHLYPAFPEIYRRFGNAARFVLIVRRPDTFTGSALARGFFDPDHPHACEHVRPPEQSPIGREWKYLQPLDKCLWYWNMVNESTIAFLETLPAHLWRVIRLEEINVELIDDLYDFFGLAHSSAVCRQITELLTDRINASPVAGNQQHVNPYSRSNTLGEIDSWQPNLRVRLQKWTQPLADRLYPNVFRSEAA